MTSPPVSQLDVTGPLAGQLVFPEINELVTRGIKASQKLVVGQWVTFDTNGYMTGATNTSTVTDGLGICTIGGDNTSGADNAITAQAAVGNTYVYATVGIGGIKPMKEVQIGSGTGNPTIQAVPAAQAVTPTAAEVNAIYNFLQTIAGRYFYHQGEEMNPTAAVSGDIVAIRLGRD